jgi:hypothetical protein
MRVFARRERPHPDAQLTLFEAGDGWRYSLWAANRAATRGWLGQAAYIDAAHRVQARAEDAIRTGKDTGLGHFPYVDSRKHPDQHEAVPASKEGGHGAGGTPGPPAGLLSYPNPKIRAQSATRVWFSASHQPR